ncbi:TcdA/TcdB catalytic glycosyltransferase domain-containing protein [Xenorhabdus bharatensis]|uniref:TcdA/TcdB catalytic glycosyltransferase domain-containing protein n=1 Tax=Xenorhabdus bharatensis TaxID=3136256 RepID=UPI0030F473AA
MNVPKKIHYFWVGNNISENDLRNIITMKSENPGFKVNIWGSGNDNSLILKTFRNIKFKNNGGEFDVGELFGDYFSYRNIESAFSFLINKSSTIINNDFITSCYSRKKHELAKFGIHFDNPSKIKKILNNIFNIKESGHCQNYSNVMKFLHHVYHLQMSGHFYNYASAGDIARLAILYMEGGIYLDVDVELTDSDIKYMKSNCFDKTLLTPKPFNRRARFEKLELKSDIGFGDCQGMGWGKIRESDEKFSNSIIASQPQSENIMAILVFMACNIKNHVYNDEDNTLSSTWRTGICPGLPWNKPLDRRCRRLSTTVDMTGPSAYQELFSLVKDNAQEDDRRSSTVKPPRDWQMSSGIDLMFKEVNNDGKWAIVNKKK